MAHMTISDADSFDALADFAGEFYKLPDAIYLDGNSLGLLCKPAEAALYEAVESWRARGILGWTDGPEPWFDMSRKASRMLATILGAEAADVMVGQSTTVNLHQLLATYYDPGGPYPKILIDEWCFPSDRYAIDSHLRLRGRDPAADLVVVPYRGHRLDTADLLAAMDDGVGLAVLPSVVYRTGQLLDMKSMTWEARKRGVAILWDCSHSAGVVPHRLRADEIDAAFGCTYKWLNGGPGSVGWFYVEPGFREAMPGLAGWFGSDPDRQFEMAATILPADDAGRFLIGTPHILSLAPVVGAMKLVNRAGLQAIRTKSLDQTRILRALLRRLAHFGIEVVTPEDDAQRGGHITLSHPSARKLSRALRSRGVIPDYRPPDLLRLAPSPLYTSFAECAKAIDILEEILTTNAHEQLSERNGPVT
ncbi:MAG TPA: kynureninase [Gemmataceae bacterium]|jgi:kynureninase|nr:kynureninase [Gemmataceae bacterium]